ncbi:type I-E CRISPR-associated protein Cse1/CasA [Janthinobacterium sp. B9-8]|uniref:type I-E CRISPR-associated protein Cse1/CasA n=1 Tax=Janthinobacterium sp. B9-8 TaxID=1236179 RepID=UPI00061CEBEA|nr:type I-E CRISPR-associated protein Cse1/CasA [Janthinobacterium sp. B9-8]AMC33239.1 hypothetical protein VN23_00695 [Janthinobacterium sp. B9-8]
MNLLDQSNAWLSFRLQDGSVSKGSVYDILMTDRIDIVSPRADFRGALYQFLIGLLQQAMPPADINTWHVLYTQPPTLDELMQAFQPLLGAFEVLSDDAAFMQDWDQLADVKPIGIENLLIDLGSDSNLFFNKTSQWAGLCEGCAAQALLTLQINAPSGGVGHRVSLRGGGPLTTLLLPQEPNASLWQKLWLNVIPTSSLPSEAAQEMPLASSLPWMTPTRDSKQGNPTTPEDVHYLQAYWSMPRRIRLDKQNTNVGPCEICGEHHEILISQYRTRNYGTNYAGAWQHPLTPYSFDAKNEKPPNPVKGKRGSSTYRQWLSLTLASADDASKPAGVVQDYSRYKGRRLRLSAPPRLWCFGFEMDNMKAKCWYDTALPLFDIAGDERQFGNVVSALLDVATEAAKQLSEQVKQARNASAREPMIELDFWQQSEAGFYALLDILAAMPDLSDEELLAPLYCKWLLTLKKLCERLFEQWVLDVPIEEMDMQRVIKAKADLSKWLRLAKPMKKLWDIVNTYQKENHATATE